MAFQFFLNGLWVHDISLWVCENHYRLMATSPICLLRKHQEGRMFPYKESYERKSRVWGWTWPGFLNLHTIDILGRRGVCCRGLSWTLWDVEQPPWLVPTWCQEHPLPKLGQPKMPPDIARCPRTGSKINLIENPWCMCLRRSPWPELTSCLDKCSGIMVLAWGMGSHLAPLSSLGLSEYQAQKLLFRSVFACVGKECLWVENLESIGIIAYEELQASFLGKWDGNGCPGIAWRSQLAISGLGRTLLEFEILGEHGCGSVFPRVWLLGSVDLSVSSAAGVEMRMEIPKQPWC